MASLRSALAQATPAPIRHGTFPLLLGLFPTLIILIVYLISILIPPTTIFEYPRVESIFDGIVGYIALNIAVLVNLSRKYQNGETYSRYSFAAAALFAIGALRFISSTTEIMSAGLWLHTLSRVVGGSLFALAWFRPVQFGRDSPFRRLPGIVLGLCLAFGIGIVVCHRYLPSAFFNVSFSLPLEMLSVVAAIFFLIATYTGLQHLDDKNYDTTLVAICVFCAAAGFLSPFTYLWGPRWWLVQFLELFPFILALVYKFRAYQSLQDELLLARDSLRKSNESLEHFAYMASHDLQEPLRTVSSFLTLLEVRNKATFDKDSREFIAFSVDAVGRMQSYIKDLLQYSRLGKEGGPVVPVAAFEAIEDAKKNLHRVIEQTSAEIVVEDLPKMKIHKSQLVLLFQNLISNSIKFRGPDIPRVFIGSRVQGKERLFTISDNGIGFDPAQSDRIFEMFQRAHGKHEYPGTGIGLSACKKLVESWGGRIWAVSQPNHGAIFYFTVPTKLLS